MATPLKTFIIYAHEDLAFKTSLERHMKHLVKAKKIELWSDREIKPGELWDDSIKLNLQEAEVILMLISVDFYNSEYIQDEEFTRAKEKFDRGEALLIPVLVRYCSWKSYDLIKDLQALPPNAKSVDMWRSFDEAFTKVAEGIEKLVDDLLYRKEEKFKKEKALAEQIATSEKVEKVRKKEDEANWKATCDEIKRTTDLLHKIEFLEEYLKEKGNINHREEAEENIQQLEADHKAAVKIAAQKKKQEEEKAIKAAAEKQRHVDETSWQIAFRINTIESYEKYLFNIENKIYRNEARKKLQHLKSNFSLYKNGQVMRALPDTPEMIFVTGGSFQMGSNDNEYESEIPMHSATVSNFWIGKYPVTFKEFDVFCAETKYERPNDQGWGRVNRPVINISWINANAYCEWLSKKTGQSYRLPTEAEWEFAARGGALSKKFTWSGSNNLDEIGWYQENSKGKTQPVGQKKSNELGLFDMSGNVLEWCNDWFNIYPTASPENYAGPTEGSHRVARGGGWYSYPLRCRVTYRHYWLPDACFYYFGFRIALSAEINGKS